MNHIEAFVEAMDRRGNPLFPGAMIVAEHGGLALIDWLSTEGDTRRTLVDGLHGHMAPGIAGDATHVHRWLVRQSNKIESGGTFHA